MNEGNSSAAGYICCGSCNTREMTQERSNEMDSNMTRIRNGKNLVIAGFGIAILGIVLYCMSSFSVGFGQDEPVFIKESLGIVGVGVLVWLVGAVKYLNAAIDSDTPDEHLF